LPVEYLFYVEFAIRNADVRIDGEGLAKNVMDATLRPNDSNSQWYVAEVVTHTVIEDDPDSFTTIDTVLLAARTEDDAYKKALEYGRSCARESLNSDGKRVQIDFRGLRNLFLVTDGLVDGGLLFYEELTGLTDSDIAKIVKPTLEIAAFQPIGEPLENNQT
jgi:hypothetical protein